MTIINDDTKNISNHIKDETIDLIITSPPYDDLRDYTGDNNWDLKTFKVIAKELYKKLKDGGTLIWIVNDKYIKGSRSLTTWKQLIYFVDEVGFRAHDIMVWEKPSFGMPSSNRNHQVWEPMLILTKGKVKTFNQIKDHLIKARNFANSSTRLKDGTMKKTSQKEQDKRGQYGARFNVWKAKTSAHENPTKKIEHPATFPFGLVKDLIYQYSNEGDIVLDPFMGSGTTGIACGYLARNFVGIEISKKYAKLAEERIIKWLTDNKGEDCGDVRFLLDEAVRKHHG